MYPACVQTARKQTQLETLSTTSVAQTSSVVKALESALSQSSSHLCVGSTAVFVLAMSRAGNLSQIQEHAMQPESARCTMCRRPFNEDSCHPEFEIADPQQGWRHTSFVIIGLQMLERHACPRNRALSLRFNAG